MKYHRFAQLQPVSVNKMHNMDSLEPLYLLEMVKIYLLQSWPEQGLRGQVSVFILCT